MMMMMTMMMMTTPVRSKHLVGKDPSHQLVQSQGSLAPPSYHHHYYRHHIIIISSSVICYITNYIKCITCSLVKWSSSAAVWAAQSDYIVCHIATYHMSDITTYQTSHITYNIISYLLSCEIIELSSSMSSPAGLYHLPYHDISHIKHTTYHDISQHITYHISPGISHLLSSEIIELSSSMRGPVGKVTSHQSRSNPCVQILL